MNNAFFQLREDTLATCTRPFKARGSIIKRCSNCHLATFACLCPWQLSSTSDIHFTLIIHRKELYKTTNTGRLIADLLPHSSSAYLWSRTEPEPQLLAEIRDPSKRTVLLFPENQTTEVENTGAESVGLENIGIRNTGIKNTATLSKQTRHIENSEAHANNGEDSENREKPLNVILLDGTWKQASRMANLSPWLQGIERLSLDSNQNADIQHTNLEHKQQQHYIRKAPLKHQLSTAQAAACVLRKFEDNENAMLLEHYFSVFNQHCIATRRNIKPNISDAHRALTAAKNKPIQGK